MRAILLSIKPAFVLGILPFILLLSLAAPVSAQTESETREFLEAMNKQVSFMNHTDALLMPVFQNLTALNDDMIRFVDVDKNTKVSYNCGFSAPEQRYRQAVYQKLKIPAEFRDEVLGRMETLITHIRDISILCSDLERYFAVQGHKTDNMVKGFELLKKMDRKLRQYLVAHEAWHAALTTSWSTYYMQRQGKRSPVVVIRMERALSNAHVVYLDLGYDPDFTDSKKHFAELNDNLIKLKVQYERDSTISGSEAFRKFVKHFASGYLDNLGEKGSLEFFDKFNSKYVKDANSRLIDNFNRFVNAKKFLVLNASRLPPFFVFIKPKIDLEKLAEAAPPKPDPPVVVEPKPVEPEPVKPDPEGPIKTEEPKTSALEGYAANNMVFLIDVSGSMRQGGRLDTLKASFRHLLEEMRPRDKVSIVTYSGNAMVMLKPTSAAESGKIMRVIDNLKSVGKSNVDQGLILGYQQAKTGFLPEGNNRVILITDGFISYSGGSASLIESKAENDISLSVFFFGNEANPYLDMSMLYALSAKGKGNFIAVSRSNSRASMIKEAQAVKELE